MSVVHTWSTLLPIWVLYFVFITGSIGYFHIEVTSWMKPEIPHVSENVVEPAMVEYADGFLRDNAGNATRWFINFPSERKDTARLSWSRTLTPEETENLTEAEQEKLREDNRGNADLHPVSGDVFDEQVRETGGGALLYRMHYVLHYVPRALGEYLVVICSFLMFAGLITGIVIHKKIFRDFFTFRPGKGQRSWLDTHNIFSVMTLPFQLMITFSGILFYVATMMPLVLYGPAVTLGFDIENILSASSEEELSPKNKELIEVVTEEVFGIVPPPPVSGVKTEMVPLSQLYADYRMRQPESPIFNILVQNPGDQNATVTFQADWGINRQARDNIVYSAVSGEMLSDSSQKDGASLASDVQGVFLGLHEGRFSPIMLRWLYFFTGLAGAAMIASGAILWATKRRRNHEREIQRLTKRNAHLGEDEMPKLGKGVIFVEHMNVASIIGLPVGVAAYFLANRLIPVAAQDRGALEADAMFVAWGLMFLFAILRPAKRIWSEMLWIACIAYALIPVVNLLTTQRHLGVSVMAGDWVIAGFDLTMLAFSMLFGLAAYRISVKQEGAGQSESAAFDNRELTPAE
ncbi:MAG: PepSY-associated TM helix domain-containing protein [Pseudomonadota bacterium]